MTSSLINSQTTKMANKSDLKKVKAGNYMSETQYYKIDAVDSSGVQVTNERGFKFGIGGNIVEEGLYSAHQVNEIHKVTRTELIEIFSKVGDTVFTVCFNKQPKVADINEAIEGSNKGKILPVAEMKKNIKKAFEGEERILVGYLLTTETGFGRSNVIDLEAERGSKPDWDGRMRQVDHRTLNWLIYKGVKYEVK